MARQASTGGMRAFVIGAVLALAGLCGVSSVVADELVAEEAPQSQLISMMLEEFAVDAERPFSADAGSNAWFAEHGDRSCTSCHTQSLTTSGRHQKTGKLIEPMAPSVNAQRLTQRKKINKWFLRNCKWTYGRECTAQEKGDILLWLSGQ